MLGSPQPFFGLLQSAGREGQAQRGVRGAGREGQAESGREQACAPCNYAISYVTSPPSSQYQSMFSSKRINGTTNNYTKNMGTFLHMNVKGAAPMRLPTMDPLARSMRRICELWAVSIGHQNCLLSIII